MSYAETPNWSVDTLPSQGVPKRCQKMMDLCLEVARKYPPVKELIEVILSMNDNDLKI